MMFVGGEETPWTPASIATIGAWYDASDTGSITASSGAVSQWNDKSGNGHHLTQSTGSLKPTTGTRTQNSLNVLDFDGGDYMGATTGPEFVGNALSMFIVVKADTVAPVAQGVAGIRGIGSNQYDYRCCVMQWASADTRIEYGDGGATGAPPTASYRSESVANNTTAWNYYTIQIDTSTFSLRKNTSGQSTSLASGTMTQANFLSQPGIGSDLTPLVGARNQNGSVSFHLDGAIGEIIWYESFLGSTDRNTIEAYLAAKWNL